MLQKIGRLWMEYGSVVSKTPTYLGIEVSRSRKAVKLVLMHIASRRTCFGGILN